MPSMSHESIENSKFPAHFHDIDQDVIVDLYKLNCGFIDFHERDKKFTSELLRIIKIYSLIVGGFSSIIVVLLLIASYYGSHQYAWNMVKSGIDSALGATGLGYLFIHRKSFRIAKSDPTPNYRTIFGIMLVYVSGSVLLSLSACIWSSSTNSQDVVRTFITAISAYNLLASVGLLIYTKIGDSTEEQMKIKVNDLQKCLLVISGLVTAVSKKGRVLAEV